MMQRAILRSMQNHIDGIKEYNEKHDNDIMIDMHTTELKRLAKELDRLLNKEYEEILNQMYS